MVYSGDHEWVNETPQMFDNNFDDQLTDIDPNVLISTYFSKDSEQQILQDLELEAAKKSGNPKYNLYKKLKKIN